MGHPSIALPALTMDLLFCDRLVTQTEAGLGTRFQPRVIDGLPASLARAIGALVETAKRMLDVLQLGLDLLEYRKILLMVEGRAADVGLVLAER